MTIFRFHATFHGSYHLDKEKKLKAQSAQNTRMWSQFTTVTYTDGVQNFHCSQTPVSLVGYFVDLAISAFTNGLYNLPGVHRIRK